MNWKILVLPVFEGTTEAFECCWHGFFHVFPRFSMVVHPKTTGKFPPIPWIMLYVSPKTDGTDENIFSPLFLLALLSILVFMFKLLTLNSLVALIHFPILQLARRGDCQYLSILKIFFFWWSENGIKWLDSCDALSHLIRNLRFCILIQTILRVT